ncbi:MAG: hypothetical protein IKU94_11010 [Bacteroidaceae bacterium]|nr:hypothetical protein [Bacteroidaceae bacterium]
MATPAKRKPRKPRDIVSEITKGKSFGDGERGTFEGSIYASRVDGNVWTPRQHPAVWVLAHE